jgi:hypothetical protein
VSGDPRAGLTLLEVLGAFALLAILYTVLAGKTIEGLRSEDQSRRRLEASLLADDRMTEIELALASGSVPPTGVAEEELERFRVVTEVTPLELPARPEPEADEERSLAARRAARGRQEEEVPSLLEAPKSGTAPALLGIEVTVRWDDGIYERELRRTTYAVDPAAVEAAFEAVAGLRPETPGETPAEDADGEPQAPGGRTRGKPRRPQPQPESGIPPGEPGAEP